MIRRVDARLSRWSFALVSLGYGLAAVAGEASLLPSSADARYHAAGQLVASSHCTASLVAGSATPDPDRSALLLTSAHCVLDDAFVDGANEVQVNTPAGEGWRFTPGYFQDNQANHRAFDVRRVRYATMKGVDMAVVELDATYGDLAAAGVQPLVAASPHIVGNLPIELVHVPVDGVAEDDQFLRLSTCEAGEPLRLFEGPRFWTQASRTDCAGVAGGSSGSAALRAGTSEVVGVMGTKVDARFAGCGVHRPCELTEREPVSREGASYLSLAAPFMAAFRADGSWDGAALDPGDGVKLGRVVPQFTRSDIPGEDGAMPAPWGVIVDDYTRWVRYKQGDAALIDCADPYGYSVPVYAADRPWEARPLERAEGAYALCVLGQKGIDNDWQAPEHASVLLRVIDDTPPSAAPEVDIQEESDDTWTVQLVAGYQPPYLLKVGRLGATDCGDDQKYRSVASPFIVLPKAKAPFRVCVKAMDQAGNVSPAGSRDFEAPVAE